MSSTRGATKKGPKNAKLIPNVKPANSLILPDGKIFKVQKKRQRKIYSCIPCHQRKIKCSREAPICDNCLKLAEKNPKEKHSILEACKYFDNDKKKNLKKQGVQLELHASLATQISEKDAAKTVADTPVSASDESNQLENKLDDSVASGYPPSIPVSSNVYEQGYSQQNGKGAIQFNDKHLVYKPNEESINQVMNSLAPLVSHPNQNERQRTEVNSYDENGNEDCSPTSNSNSENSSNANNENIDTNQIYGNEHYYNPPLYNQIPPSSTSESSASTEHVIVTNTPEQQLYSHYSQQFTAPFIPILANLPTKVRSDELLMTFQSNIHPLLPILDMSTFIDKYDEFWYCGLFLTENIAKFYEYYVYYKDNPYVQYPERITDFLYWYNKTKCTLNPTNFAEFLILLFAVYYTSVSSSVYENISSNNITAYKGEVNKYYNTFMKMNYKGLNNPKVMSLAVLQINVLVQSITNLKSGKSLINISKILRICQFYQLNRDPVLYHSLKDIDLVQTRRIVWWQIFLLDNMVSYFLNLNPSIKLTDFDTSLLMENVDQRSSNMFSLLYLNCVFRFSLIVDDLNGLTNGLNTHMTYEDITKVKNDINGLFIACVSTMKKINDLYSIQLKVNELDAPKGNNNIREEYHPHDYSPHIPDTKSPYSIKEGPDSVAQKIHHNMGIDSDCFKYFMYILNIYSDKILIMLQKKIILSPYILTDSLKVDSILDLRLTSPYYNYTDLQSNLLPSLIHYIDNFLPLSGKDMMKFNWKLKSYIPIDELILLMQILATNIKAGMTQHETGPIFDLNLKIYLVDQTMNSLNQNWHKKLSSVNKLIHLASNLWELMILKYNINLKLAYSLRNKFQFPKPIHDTPESINGDSQISFSSTQQFEPTETVACPEIAPRSIGAATSKYIQPDFNQGESNSFSFEERPFFEKVNLQTGVAEDLDYNSDRMTTQERCVKIAKEIEDEFLREASTNFIQDTDEDDEGWYNLGTEEELGYNSIDDFHLFKNLKSDVIRLFKFIVS